MINRNFEEAINPEFVHISVFWREILDYVERYSTNGESIFVDSTLGEGGHSELILKNFPMMKVIAFERDEEILQIAKKRLEPFGERITFINDNFSNISKYFDDSTLVNFILYDFGISSFHFDKSDRGFTFSKDQPLDMRLSSNLKLKAADIINGYREREMSDIFYKYGEERWTKKIVQSIIKRRETEPFNSTLDLAEFVLKVIPRKFHVKNIHPATRIFQALRIAVNEELQAIEQALEESYKFVEKGGVIMAISFHSLEDRLAKNGFKVLERGCTCGLDNKHCFCTNKPFVKILSKKPILPKEDEIKINSRSRSAKLRVCERL